MRVAPPAPIKGLSERAETWVVRDDGTVDETIRNRKQGWRRTGIKRDVAQQPVVVRFAIWQIVKNLRLPSALLARLQIPYVIELKSRDDHFSSKIAKLSVAKNCTEPPSKLFI